MQWENFESCQKTVDDAAGEALDKGAKLLGFLTRRSRNGKACQRRQPKAYSFPRAFPEKHAMKFSFSGLKTSLLYTLRKMSEAQIKSSFADLCASYQSAAWSARRKTQHVAESKAFKSIGLSGGVANNQNLRLLIEKLCTVYWYTISPSRERSYRWQRPRWLHMHPSLTPTPCGQTRPDTFLSPFFSTRRVSSSRKLDSFTFCLSKMSVWFPLFSKVFNKFASSYYSII